MFAKGIISAPHVILALALAGLCFAAGYFQLGGLVVALHSDPAHSPDIGLAVSFCGALFLTLVAFYLAALPAARTALENEAQGQGVIARDLQARKAKAVRAMDAKSDFLAKMSHELRTPINAVIGYSEILIEDMAAAGKDAQIGDVRKIHECGKRLLTLINDVLDLSKLNARKMEVFLERTSLAEAMREVASACSARAAEDGNKIVCDVQTGSHMVVIDKRKFQQAIAKLVGATSSTVRDGEIALACFVRNSWIEIVVSCAGAGAVDEKAAHAMGEFGSAEADSTEDSALGFALAEKLSRLMGGRLQVEGERKNGFRLALRIPAHIDGAASPAAAPDMARDEDGSWDLLPSEQDVFVKLFPNFSRRPLADRDGVILAS